LRGGGSLLLFCIDTLLSSLETYLFFVQEMHFLRVVFSRGC